jgi:DNA-binding protein
MDLLISPLVIKISQNQKVFIFFSPASTYGGLKMAKRLLPLAAMEALMKQAGADRVSDKAKVALKNVLEEKAEEIAANAVKLANHAGRTTVKEEDIKLAAKSK